MKVFLARLLVPIACGLLFCSCATEKGSLSGLPPDVKMNQEAGRGGFIFVTVSLEDGEKLPFILDTGSTGTLLDKSLEPKLGPRIAMTDDWLFGLKVTAGRYFAPRLYLGRTPIKMTGPFVHTLNCLGMSTNSGRRVMGILGMDVLGNYCVQLDFARNRVRFLDARLSDKSAWGQPFPLLDEGDGSPYIGENLVGSQGSGSLIDTGCSYDGWLTPGLFEQWTNQVNDGLTHATNGILGGEIYAGLDLDELATNLFTSGDLHMKFNGIGLHVLSRNLVTLDFPERTIYLKRISSGPLVDENMQDTARREGRSAYRYVSRIKAIGKLPGMAPRDEWVGNNLHYYFHYPASVTFDQVVKKGSPGVYHIKLARAYPHGAWKLQRVWRTDEKGRVLQEFSVPSGY